MSISGGDVVGADDTGSFLAAFFGREAAIFEEDIVKVDVQLEREIRWQATGHKQNLVRPGIGPKKMNDRLCDTVHMCGKNKKKNTHTPIGQELCLEQK